MNKQRTTHGIGLLLVSIAAVFVLGVVYGDVPTASENATAKAAAHQNTLKRGADIYNTQCLECHGDKGQGVEGAYEKPLSGDRTLAWLTRRVEKTMPEGEAERCVGEDAAAVSVYLYEQFYSAKARAKDNASTGRTLQRLTAEQHRQSLADLVGSFRESKSATDQRGLWMQVYPGRDMKKNTKPIAKHVVSTLSETYTPEHLLYEKFDKLGHSVRWSGALLVDETGQYEIIVKSDNAMRLWLNNRKARGGGISNEITDTPEAAFMDGWLQSKDKTEWRKKVFLIGGRSYPLMLEFSAHNQGVGNKNDQAKHLPKNTSYVSLHWVKPRGAEEVIPQRHLMPQRSPEVFVMSTPFPPDDASMGFISGADVSEAWLNATTRSAIQTANTIAEHLDELAGTTAKAPDRRERVLTFCKAFVGRAFARPLNEDEIRQQVTRYFDDDQDLKPAVKRVVLAALLSPRFLYPQADTKSFDSYDAASALALAMWDSLPDAALLTAAAKGELVTSEQLAAHALRMRNDPRAKAKLMRFFHHWLELQRAENVAKDKTLFPEFDQHLLADLRTSLNLFLEHTVFSETSDYRELLLADHLYVNDRIAEVYGIDRGEAEGKGFTRTDVPSDHRSGVITHPYLLTAFAYHNSTSPIHRGVFLTRNIIGRPLNPPPDAIAFDGAEFDPDLTMREKVTAFTRDTACMACHETINPLGFSLEHYDSLGRWRTEDKNKPVNAESDFMGDDGKTLRLKGARDVANYAVQSEAAHQVFIRLLFQHMAQRDPSDLSPQTLKQLNDTFAQNDYHIQDLFMQIAVTNAWHGLQSRQQEDSP